MHELAVCRSLIAEVERVAADHDAEAVETITLLIGPLAGVEPEQLRNAFSIARAGTIADGAELIIEEAGVRVRCTTCDAEGEAAANRLLCPACGDWRVRVVAGDALLLKSLALRGAVAVA